MMAVVLGAVAAHAAMMAVTRMLTSLQPTDLELG